MKFVDLIIQRSPHSISSAGIADKNEAHLLTQEATELIDSKKLLDSSLQHLIEKLEQTFDALNEKEIKDQIPAKFITHLENLDKTTQELKAGLPNFEGEFALKKLKDKQYIETLEDKFSEVRTVTRLMSEAKDIYETLPEEKRELFNDAYTHVKVKKDHNKGRDFWRSMSGRNGEIGSILNDISKTLHEAKLSIETHQEKESLPDL